MSIRKKTILISGLTGFVLGVLITSFHRSPKEASLNLAGDRHAVWKPSEQRRSADPKLGSILKKISINNEVLVAVSNKNYAQPGGMLEVWVDGVTRAGIKNVLIIALDDETKRNVESRGINVFRMDVEIPESQKNTGSNHAVSALKFRILKRFMELGYSVLLSDVDIVTLQNPFEHLVRDSDVESMSDGWDAGTAYGYNDVLVSHCSCFIMCCLIESVSFDRCKHCLYLFRYRMTSQWVGHVMPILCGYLSSTLACFISDHRRQLWIYWIN